MDWEEIPRIICPVASSLGYLRIQCSYLKGDTVGLRKSRGDYSLSMTTPTAPPPKEQLQSPKLVKNWHCHWLLMEGGPSEGLW